MKMKWKQTMVMFILSVSLLIPSVPIHAVAEEANSISSGADDYRLTNSIKAAVKSILNEPISEGTRIGAVVRLYNEGSQLTRVPENEVRVRTEEGIEYTLRPSVTNEIAIQPKETVDLSYMIVVDRDDAFSLSELSWVDVDEFVYPKEERKVLSIPVSSIEWKGDKALLSDPSVIKKWGEAFTIPVLSNWLEYKPVSLIDQNTPQGPMTIVGLLAINKSDVKKSIPEFRIDGKSDNKVYNGKRLEQGTLELEPGEQVYIHYAIPAENRVELKHLTILTQEEFTDGQTNINYSIGRLSVTLPDGSNTFRYMNQLLPYEWNKPIRFDPLYKLIQPEVDISMASLHTHESAGGGFKAAVAKFKLQNRSDRPMPVPHFEAQMVSMDGNKYTGTRQNTKVDTLIPNISYVIYYSFILPSKETGEQLGMEILDGETVTPFNIPIAAFKTQALEAAGDNSLAFYPFKVNVSSWMTGTTFNMAQGNLTYSYNLDVDVDINLQDEAVVDQSYSKMKVELVDAKGGIIGSKAFSFTGENGLSSGMQTVSFRSERFETSLFLRIYETIDTPFGEAERLIETLH